MNPNNEDKVFFLNVLEDLRQKCVSNSNYDLIKAAGLSRQLLIDAPPLIDYINKEYREQVQFKVNRRSTQIPTFRGPNGKPLIHVMSFGFVNPPESNQFIEYLNKDQFLKYKVLDFHGYEITLHELLRLNANKKGGVHLDSSLNGKESIVNMANSAFSFSKDVSGGSYSISEMGKIVLNALSVLEEKVRADLNRKV